MNDNAPLTVPLELPLEDLVWLRSFLDAERSAANIDRQKALDEIHTTLARRAAVQAIHIESDRMTTIIDEICRVVDIYDAHDALAKQINTL